MAVDLQTVTAGVTSGTFADYIQLDGGGVGVLPFAKMSYRGAFTLDGSGAADTAVCRITLPLPHNVVWQLDTWFLETQGTGAAYSAGQFEMYFAPSTVAFGASTQLDYVIYPSGPGNSDDSVADINNWQFGSGRSLIVTGGTSNQRFPGLNPFQLISFQDPSGGADPVISIGSFDQVQAASGTCRFTVEFLGYTYEQMSHAALHVGLNTRD